MATDMRLEFTITADHAKLLRRMYVGWCDDEYGAPEIDPKRPYGNSGVADDIAEILGWPIADEDEGLTDEQRDRAYEIHHETQTVLQIVLTTGTFNLGTYRRASPYESRGWTFSGVPQDDSQ